MSEPRKFSRRLSHVSEGTEKMRVSQSVTYMDPQRPSQVSHTDEEELQFGSDRERSSVVPTGIRRDSFGNKTSWETDLSDKQWAGKTGLKRKNSRDETSGQEINTSKKGRYEIQDSKMNTKYNCNDLMEWIRLKYLPQIPQLKMFGFQFRTPFRLELENNVELPLLIQAIVNNVPITSQSEDLNETQHSDSNVIEQELDGSDRYKKMTPPFQPTNVLNDYDYTKGNETNKNNQSWYSDISGDEEDIDNNSSLNSGQNVSEDGSHIDTPPPCNYSSSKNYNTQAKGNTLLNPDKGKTIKHKGNEDARKSIVRDVPPEIDKVSWSDTAGKSTPFPIAQRNTRTKRLCKTKEISAIVDNAPSQMEKVQKIHSPIREITQENKIDEEYKIKLVLPNFEKIFKCNELKGSREKSCTANDLLHEYVKQKLKKLLKKEKSDLVAIKVEEPDSTFDCLEVEDPEATLMYGFDGPGGKIVPHNETENTF